MAVVDNYSDETFGVLDAAQGTRGDPDYTQYRGNLHIASGSVANTASDNSGSKYRLIRLASSVILHPDSKIDLQGWGFAAATVGIDVDPDALLASVTIAGLSAPSAPVVFGDSRWNKPLWQQVGLSDDPKSDILLSIHTVADAAAAGSAKFEIHYLTI